MKLNELNKTTTNRKRVGRGIASGTGKTCGRGHKGQKSRSGVSINGFEGGQQPIYIRLPKFGFTNIFRKEFTVINLGDLQAYVDAGKIDATKPVSPESLYECGVTNRKNARIKVLSKGELKSKLILEVDAVSKAALKVIENSGGSVALRAKAA
jgi:large subunit ribosomal protein L15